MPERYLLVWMGGAFTYPSRLAVDAIRIAAPSAAVEIHVLGDDAADSPHLRDLLTGDEGIELHRIDPLRLFAPHRGVAEVFHAMPPGAHSARSNLVRYALLHARGGVYLDVDVLLLRPIHHLGGGQAFVGLERVWRHDRPRVEGRYRPTMVPGTVGWALAWAARRADTRWFGGSLRLADRLRVLDRLWSELQPNNAVLGAPAGSEFTALVLDAAASADPAVRYATGPSLVADVARRHPDTVRLLPEVVCYPVPPSESHRFFDDRTLQLSPDTALIHYVNSNHRDLLASLGPGDLRFAHRPELFWRLCHDVIAGRATSGAPLSILDLPTVDLPTVDLPTLGPAESGRLVTGRGPA